MVIFGGFIDGERTAGSYRFNFKTSEWSAILVDVSVGRPSARAGHSAVVNDKYMYIFGGKDNDDVLLNDLWRLDLESDVWEQVKVSDDSQVPQGRCGHSSVVYNGHILIFGGIFEITRELNDCYIFNLSNKRWLCLFNNSGQKVEVKSASETKRMKTRREDSPDAAT